MEGRTVEFWKYSINGNDFIMIDNYDLSEHYLTKEEIKGMCDRHNGIGADTLGIILAPPPGSRISFKTVYMIVDGSEEYVCGDSTLAFTALATLRQYVPPQTEFTFSTLAGIHTAQFLQDGRSKVKIGKFYTKAKDIPFTLLPSEEIVQEFPILIGGREWKINAFSIGKVAARICIFVETFDNFESTKWGKIIQEHLLDIKCLPKAMIALIITFIEVVDRKKISIRTYENVYIGETQCCGTGSCAAALAAYRLGFVDTTKVEVMNPGGLIEVEYDAVADELSLTGEARLVFKGTYFLPPKNIDQYIFEENIYE